MHEDIERRLQNWGRWKHGAGAGGLGYAKVRVGLAGEQVDCDRDLGAVVPTINVEAEETDRAVLQLASELRATVEVYYVLGGSVAQKAQRLAVTEATVYARLRRVRYLVSVWLSEQALVRQRERERMGWKPVAPPSPWGEF